MKIFGFIDYITALFDLIIGIILFTIIHLIFKNIMMEIYIFIIIFIPILLFSILESSGENIVIYIICIIKFINKRKIYFYEKVGKFEDP